MDIQQMYAIYYQLVIQSLFLIAFQPWATMTKNENKTKQNLSQKTWKAILCLHFKAK